MPNYYLRRGSEFFYLGSLSALAISSLYCTYRISKHFFRAQLSQKTDPMGDFPTMIDDMAEKSTIGLSSALTLFTLSVFLSEANRMA